MSTDFKISLAIFVGFILLMLAAIIGGPMFYAAIIGLPIVIGLALWLTK